jgi:hypothetical protein
MSKYLSCTESAHGLFNVSGNKLQLSTLILFLYGCSRISPHGLTISNLSTTLKNVGCICQSFYAVHDMIVVFGGETGVAVSNKNVVSSPVFVRNVHNA